MTAPETEVATSIDTYKVTCTHPALDGPLVVELIATSERAAISRTRLSAFHMYKDARLLDGTYEVTGKKAGVWPDGRPEDAIPAVCRVCGCTEDDCSKCVAATGVPCAWVTPTLCSRCTP